MTVIWDTGHALSTDICNAFSEGSGLEVKHVHEFDREIPVPSVVYGILRGCNDVLASCRRHGVDYWHIDHSYFGTEGFYRVTKNARFYKWNGESYPPDRSSTHVLGVIHDKIMYGGDILVCPPTRPQAELDGFTPHEWIGDAVEYAAKNWPENPIRVCPKGRDTAALFSASEALLTYNSTIGVKAAIAGLKVYAPYLADELRDDTEGWINALAYQQFSVDEIKNGTAWESVK